MPWHPTLSQLRDRLADLYPTEADARRVVATAGLDDRRIAFYPVAVNTWQSIVEEADKQGQVDALMRVATSEYSTHATLLMEVEAYRRVASEPPAQSARDKGTAVDERMPERLKDLVAAGCARIDIPDRLAPRRKQRKGQGAGDYLFFELRMRQTDSVLVCRVLDAVTVGDAATYLAKNLLPKMATHYEWTLAQGDTSLPRDAAV